MTEEMILSLVVLAPVAGAFLLPLLGSVSEQLRNMLALGLVLVSVVGSMMLIPTVYQGTTVTAEFFGFRLFYADQLAVFMAMVSSFVGAIIVLYSFGYISRYEHRNEYYFMVVLFLGSMMGLIYSRNIIFIYLFWEITALACWRLIGFFREKEYVWRADKAFLITVFGALVMLIGFLAIYSQAGSFDLLDMKLAMGTSNVYNIAVVLALFGILSKSATVPLHTWLPDAGVAPAPVTALLHAAVLVKIGVYVYARLFVATFTIDPLWHTIIPVIAGVSALIAAGAALKETDIKRLIAYSTISQLGFILLGLSIGTKIGIAGGLIYILMHSISKGGLFLCAGIVEQKTHIKNIQQLGGLGKVMPITAVAFLVCAFSVMGIPPLGGFFGKYFVIAGAVDSGQMAIAGLFIFGAVLTVLYLLRAFSLVFLGTTKLEGDLARFKEGSTVMVASVLLLAVLSIFGGIFYNYPSDFVHSTVEQMLGTVK